MPQIIYPARINPFARNVEATAKNRVAFNHSALAEHNIPKIKVRNLSTIHLVDSPLYEKYVKKGSVEAENRRVAGLLGSSDSKHVKYAMAGEPKWCRVRSYSVVTVPHRSEASPPPASKWATVGRSLPLSHRRISPQVRMTKGAPGKKAHSCS